MLNHIAPLVHGGALAMGLALPLGPQDYYILNQGAVQECWRRILPVILIAVFTDSAWILASVFWSGSAILCSPILQVVLLATGVVLLVQTGYSQWNQSNAPADAGLANRDQHPRKQILAALSLSILNPYAAIDFVTVIGPSSLTYTGADRWAFTLGCLVNSWLWFPMLAVAGHFACRHLLNSDNGRRIGGRLSAVVVWLCAGFLLVTLGRASKLLVCGA